MSNSHFYFVLYQNGWTALINAAYWCQPEAVRVLLKNRACVDLQNKDDRTALHECCRSQSTGEQHLADIAEMLIEAGSDINAKSSDLGWVRTDSCMYDRYYLGLVDITWVWWTLHGSGRHYMGLVDIAWVWETLHGSGGHYMGLGDITWVWWTLHGSGGHYMGLRDIT